MAEDGGLSWRKTKLVGRKDGGWRLESERGTKKLNLTGEQITNEENVMLTDSHEYRDG